MTRKYILLAALLLCLAIVGMVLFKRASPSGNAFNTVSGQESNSQLPADKSTLLAQNGSSAEKILDEWLRSRSVPGNEVSAQEVIDRLHNSRRYNEDFNKIAQQILLNPSIDLQTKMELLHILTRSATPSAVRLFADLCQMNLPEDLKQQVYSSISQTGDYFWDKESLPEVAPIIIKLWDQARDPKLLNALASAIVKMGDIEGITALFKEVLSPGKTLDDIRQSKDPRVTAALLGLESISNPNVVQVIAAHLNNSSNSVELNLCIRLLASTGGSEGMHQVLSWAEGANDSYASLIHEVLAGASPAVIQSANTAVNGLNFRSDKIKEAILSALGK
jgi:hypothetical protein